MSWRAIEDLRKSLGCLNLSCGPARPKTAQPGILEGVNNSIGKRPLRADDG